MKIILILVISLAILVAVISIKVILPTQIGVVAKKGKKYEVLNSGIHVLLPIFNTMGKVIDVRSTKYNCGIKDIMMKDNIKVNLEIRVFYKITDPIKYVTTFREVDKAIDFFIEGAIKNIVYTIYSYHLIDLIEDIRLEVLEEIQEKLSSMGIEVEGIDIHNILMPSVVVQAYEDYAKTLVGMQEELLKVEYEKKCMLIQAKCEAEINIIKAKGIASSYQIMGNKTTGSAKK